jgi:hypothetical protein
VPLIDAIPPIRGLRGHPLQRPRVICADRGYNSERHQRALRNRGIACHSRRLSLPVRRRLLPFGKHGVRIRDATGVRPP